VVAVEHVKLLELAKELGFVGVTAGVGELRFLVVEATNLYITP